MKRVYQNLSFPMLFAYGVLSGSPAVVALSEVPAVIFEPPVFIAGIEGDSLDLAEGKYAYASSYESQWFGFGEQLQPWKAVDGNAKTRWASDWSDEEWVYVDLDQSHRIQRVVLNWAGDAYAKEYKIQVSEDKKKWIDAFHEQKGNGGRDALGVDTQGRYVRMQGIIRGSLWGYSLNDFKVYAEADLALGKAVAVSSNEKESLSPLNVVDGDDSTRWSSQWSNDEYLTIDLGADSSIRKVVLNWDVAYAKRYQIQVSDDNQGWSTLRNVKSGDGGIDSFTLAGQGRYVKIMCKKGATPFGFSLKDVQVFGSQNEPENTDQRNIITLDGQWGLTQANRLTLPDSFNSKVPVPGLTDMSEPLIEVSDDDNAYFYKRTFSIDDDVPPVAKLRIGKARYGKRVFLNGFLVAEHLPNFTLAIVDVSDALRGNGLENELVIRVGTHTQVPEHRIWGEDMEQKEYVPGIYDSVQLHLSGVTSIDHVQTVPNISHDNVRIVASINQCGPNSTTDVDFEIREVSTGLIVGSQYSTINMSRGEKAKLDVEISIANMILWSPENPFLYELITTTANDQEITRFGMREFGFDSARGTAVLNGQPHMMRGTQIVMYRFFEDEDRGNIPWDEEWIRAFYKEIKAMNWTSFRFHVGLAPEIWYRLADEEGLMIQDEYPVWYPFGWDLKKTAEPLVEEFSDWILERVNHPSVVIFDSLNETPDIPHPVAIDAAEAVRHLDLSNRPWDHSWNPATREDQPYESHPYYFFAALRDTGFTLAKLETTPKKPFVTNIIWQLGTALLGLPTGSLLYTKGHPTIVNEYGWLWLTRDEGDTLSCGYAKPTLRQETYERLIGANSTEGERREMYARYMASLTEFWRHGRKAAGVQFFPALSNGSQCTSDPLKPGLETPEFNDEFKYYMQDAFEPVGVMINRWWDGSNDVVATLEASSTQWIPVSVINDLTASWEGEVTLLVTNLQGEVVTTGEPIVFAVDTLGKVEQELTVPMPDVAGIYLMVAKYTKANGEAVQSIRKIEVD